jgi:hypothetical protein
MRSNNLKGIGFIKENIFPSLEELSLDYNLFNPQQFIELKRFKNLKRIDISFNKIKNF